MTPRLNPARLDLSALAQSDEPLSGEAPLSAFERLTAEAASPSDEAVRWSAHAEWRRPGVVTGVGRADAPVLWLHLDAQARLPLVCQRCLGEVLTGLQADRWFRFVADEATAEAEDEDSDEDVLVFSKAFDLNALVEDELIMALPLVPLHETCPTEVKTRVGDAGVPEGEARPNPFAALARLKKGA